jgi:predicted ATP-grasp superfamily ATP-dependent carboligase
VEDKAGFERWLIETVHENHITFVQPVTEISCQTVLAIRDKLPKTCIVPFVDLETILRVSNKATLIELAKEVKIKVPRSRCYAKGIDLPLEDFTEFPLVLKPFRSQIETASGWLSTSVSVAHSSSELERLVQERPEFRDHPILLQEFIPGHGAGVFALYDKGKVVTTFAHRRVREKPPAGGVSVLSESVLPSPAIRDAAISLLDRVGWHGVAMVEFRVDAEGTPHLMEVNTRFWGSLQLAIDAGIDFPWLLYCLSMGLPFEPPTTYRVGKRLRWFLGDIDSLYLYLRDPKFSQFDKAIRILDFITPRPFTTRHEVFRWSDPLPGVFEFKGYVRHLIK